MVDEELARRVFTPNAPHPSPSEDVTQMMWTESTTENPDRAVSLTSVGFVKAHGLARWRRGWAISPLPLGRWSLERLIRGWAVLLPSAMLTQKCCTDMSIDVGVLNPSGRV